MSLASVSMKEIGLLAMSPAFAMSLGAKELFHTNFLGFLLEVDDPTLVGMQRAIRAALGFPCTNGAVSRCAVWREKNSLDLLVVELYCTTDSAVRSVVTSSRRKKGRRDARQAVGVWDWTPERQWEMTSGKSAAEENTEDDGSVSRLSPTGNVLIVEAKLKSIPQRTQLDEYDGQLNSRGINLEFPEDAAVPEWRLAIGRASPAVITRTLLSVAGDSMATVDGTARQVWIGVSWKKLYEAMVAASSTLNSSPLQGIVTDYIQVLGALVKLLGRVHRMCDDARTALRNKPAYGAVRRQPLHPFFRSLRISDLLGKTLFDAWLHALMAERHSPDLPDGWSLNWYVNYSRGVPGLGVELVNRSFRTRSGGYIGLKIGVQIQNCEFRIFVDVDQEWKGLEAWIATHPVLLPDWYRTPVFGVTPVGIRGADVAATSGKGRATSLKKFGVNRFLYSKVDIDHYSFDLIEAELWRLIGKASTLLTQLQDSDREETIAQSTLPITPS